MNDQQQSRADALTSMFAAHPELQDDRAVFLASQVRAMLRNVLADSANETGAEGATWYDRWQAECMRDHGEYDENAPIADRLRWWVPKSARHGTILLEDDLREAADELSRSPAMAAAAPADDACKRCGSTTAQACNDVGCFYLESGDGEPSAAQADERAAGMPDEVRDSMMDSQYLAGVTAGWNAANADDPNAALKKIHDAYSGYLNPLRDWQKAGRPGAPATPATADERAAFDLAEFCELIDAYQCAQKDGTHDERAKARFALMNAYRAAASLAAEAVAFEVTEEIAADWAKRHDIEHVLKHHSTQRNAIEDARTLHLIDAPQPAHAEAASPAAEGETEDHECVYENGDGVCRQCAELAKHHRAAASPAAEVVRLQHVATAEDGGKLRWMTGRRPRDCELYAMPDGGRAPATLYTAPQHAQADAPAEAREPLNEVLFGNDEALEMAADALDRLGDDSAAAGVRAVAYELRLLAHKARCAPADAGEAAPFGWAQLKGGNYFTRNELSAKRIGGLVPVYTVPPTARMAVMEFLRDMAQQRPEKPDHWNSCRQCERNAERASDLLNGADQ